MELSIELKQKIEQYQQDGTLLANFIIDDNTKYETSIDLLKQIKAKSKELETERKKITDPLDATKKAVMDLFRKPIESLDNASEWIKKSALAFVQKQEAIRLAEQKRLQDEAEAKQIELDEKIAEKQAMGKDTSKLEAKKGEIITPVLQSNVTKISGTFVKKTWKARVIDFKAMPDDYKIPNEKALNSLAQATAGTIKIAGVEFYFDEQIISRGL